MKQMLKPLRDPCPGGLLSLAEGREIWRWPPFHRDTEAEAEVTPSQRKIIINKKWPL